MHLLRTKNRRRLTAGVLAAAALSLTACGQGGVFSDAGTRVTTVPDRSQYLDLSMLSGEGNMEDGWNSYTTYTLEYGTFSTAMSNMRADLQMLETTCVKAEYEVGNMRLVEMLAEKYQFVKAGTPVAKVTMEIDEVDLQELERKLLRLQQRYIQAQEEFEESQEEKEVLFAKWPPQRTIDITRYEQAQLDFQRIAGEYERQIAGVTEQIEKLRGLSVQTEIVAPEDGFILDVSLLQKGQKLDNGTILLRLAPADKICLEFDDRLQHYGYGNRVTLSAGNKRSADNYDAMVVSISGKALSGEWDVGVSRLVGDYDIGQLLGNGPFNVSGQTNVMENVLLVPAEAVTIDKRKYYVTVLGEGGSMTKTQFIPGGGNDEYYWVFDGLQEGTRIVMP